MKTMTRVGFVGLAVVACSLAGCGPHEDGGPENKGIAPVLRIRLYQPLDGTNCYHINHGELTVTTGENSGSIQKIAYQCRISEAQQKTLVRLIQETNALHLNSEYLAAALDGYSIDFWLPQSDGKTRLIRVVNYEQPDLGRLAKFVDALIPEKKLHLRYPWPQEEGPATEPSTQAALSDRKDFRAIFQLLSDSLSPDWEKWKRDALSRKAEGDGGDPDTLVKLAELKERSCGGMEVDRYLALALEIDPNHVRANLFRGLRLALRWVDSHDPKDDPGAHLRKVLQLAKPDTPEHATAAKALEVLRRAARPNTKPG